MLIVVELLEVILVFAQKHQWLSDGIRRDILYMESGLTTLLNHTGENNSSNTVWTQRSCLERSDFASSRLLPTWESRGRQKIYV